MKNKFILISTNEVVYDKYVKYSNFSNLKRNKFAAEIFDTGLMVKEQQLLDKMTMEEKASLIGPQTNTLHFDQRNELLNYYQEKYDMNETEYAKLINISKKESLSYLRPFQTDYIFWDSKNKIWSIVSEKKDK